MQCNVWQAAIMLVTSPNLAAVMPQPWGADRGMGRHGPQGAARGRMETTSCSYDVPSRPCPTDLAIGCAVASVYSAPPDCINPAPSSDPWCCRLLAIK